jgi:hypothetical protein
MSRLVASTADNDEIMQWTPFQLCVIMILEDVIHT